MPQHSKEVISKVTRRPRIDQIMQTVNNEVREIFLDAPGGTGKTHRIRLIMAATRS